MTRVRQRPSDSPLKGDTKMGSGTRTVNPVVCHAIRYFASVPRVAGSRARRTSGRTLRCHWCGRRKGYRRGDLPVWGASIRTCLKMDRARCCHRPSFARADAVSIAARGASQFRFTDRHHGLPRRQHNSRHRRATDRPRAGPSSTAVGFLGDGGTWTADQRYARVLPPTALTLLGQSGGDPVVAPTEGGHEGFECCRDAVGVAGGEQIEQ